MPAPSAAQQRVYVSEVVQVTNADAKTAAKLLAKSNWNTAVAINTYVDTLPFGGRESGMVRRLHARGEEWAITAILLLGYQRIPNIPLTHPLKQLLQQPLQHRLKSHPQSSRPDLRPVPHKPQRVAQRARHRGHRQTAGRPGN